uniref:Odorant receptor n=2 Tax=Meteorus pulchricornis TaxID=51522 RepID=A0A1S5VFS0_9HYME|nr:olfactory receptor 79 [Meteorus pulchricornis]
MDAELIPSLKYASQTTPERSGIDSDVEAHHALQITRWQLKLLGIWPLSLNSSGFEKMFTNVKIILCSFLLVFIIVPGGLFTYVIIKDFNVRIKLTGALSFCVMAIMKYASLLMRRQEIDNCIRHLLFDWRQVTSANSRIIMKNCAEFGRWGSIICAIFMYSGGIFYAVILPCVTPSTENEQNVTIKPLAYPSYYVWIESQENIAYIVIFSTHCCCAIVMHSITSTTCSVAVVFSMHACGQLKIVTSPLSKLINASKKTVRADRILPEVIEHHTNTLRFIDNIEKILNKSCLVEVGGCTLNICLLGYYFLLEWEDSDAIGIMTYTILLMSFTFNIFLFCYIGDLLTEECRKVGDAVYMIDWLEMSGNNIRQLILILITAQNPITITAGKFIDLSLVNFCTVIRTSLAYLSFLRKFIE